MSGQSTIFQADNPALEPELTLKVLFSNKDSLQELYPNAEVTEDLSDNFM